MEMPEDDATQPVQRKAEQSLQSSLELHIQRLDRSQTQVVPIHRSQFEYDFEDGGQLRFTLVDQEMRFRNLKSLPLYKDGALTNAGRLEVGSSLEYGSQRIILWDTGQPLAYLRGYSEPYSNDIWPLKEEHHPIGRAGRRNNLIQLDHPTVSREHATIVQGPAGRFKLLAESSTNLVYLRGSVLEAGTAEELEHGDLVEIGELVFRFHQPLTDASTIQTQSQISVESLGALQVTVGDQVLNDKAWKTQFVKWIFARLAFQWGKPVAIEQLLEELWPEADADKARNNFKFSLSTLRQMLRQHLPEDLQNTEIIHRSSSTIQLNSELLNTHDVVQIQRGLALCGERAKVPNWSEIAEQTVLAYKAPFLSECYLEWAVTARQTLELQVFDLAKRLLQELEQEEQWSKIIPVATHLMALDRLNQWPCLLLMRSLRHSQRPAEALRIFEQNRKYWLKELDAEPEVELLREQQRLLALT